MGMGIRTGPTTCMVGHTKSRRLKGGKVSRLFVSLPLLEKITKFFKNISFLFLSQFTHPHTHIVSIGFISVWSSCLDRSQGRNQVCFLFYFVWSSLKSGKKRGGFRLVWAVKRRRVSFKRRSGRTQGDLCVKITFMSLYSMEKDIFTPELDLWCRTQMQKDSIVPELEC